MLKSGLAEATADNRPRETATFMTTMTAAQIHKEKRSPQKINKLMETDKRRLMLVGGSKE
jgi:hypothetical protein